MPESKNAKIVLIIEDNELLVRSISRVFSDNFDLRIAGSVTEARRKLLSLHELDAMIVDVKLPDGNGLDVIEEVRKSCHALPIVVITGYYSPEISLRVLTLSAGLLLKPFEKRHLEMIRDYLARLPKSELFHGDTVGHAELYRNLSEKQREVIELALEDNDRESMCKQLEVSRNTLKTYIRRILDKSGAKSLREVTRRVRRKSPHPFN